MMNYPEINNNNDEMNNEKKMHVRDMLKKGMTAGICAALIGGMTLGTVAFAQESSDKSGRATLFRTAEETEEQADAAETTETAETAADAGTTKKGNLDVSDIVAAAMPSVVSITTKSVEEVQDYYSMFGFGGYAPQEREVEGRGSGVIIGKNDDELLIATNYHVVEGANTISVAFVDNAAVEGKVKGYDEGKDLAVIAVKKDDISTDTLNEISIAKIGSSDDLKVGEQVVAIGNAMGYGQSVTTGILSAKTHYSDLDGNFYSTDDGSAGVNLLQTDAAINPGNSGGALLNMDGELVGINCAKLASTEVEGMGYAIAISDVDDEVIEELMNEEVRDKLAADEHGILGITGATVSAEEATKYGFPTGVYVAEVTEDGPAAKAGIQKGDFITQFKYRSLSTIQQLIEYLNYYKPGEEIELTIIRNGEEQKVNVTLGEQTKEYKENAGITSDEAASDENADPNAEQTPDGSAPEEYADDYSGDNQDPWDGFFSDWGDDYRDRDDIWDSWGDGLHGGY